MTSVDNDLAVAVELASLTSDRSRREQAALLRASVRLDKRRARQVVTNPEPVKPYLEGLVRQTWECNA